MNWSQKQIPSQKGQAATEFVIAAAFVLVPLFLTLPLLGKYIDIKHAAIQHARYTAWEYTVWFGQDEYIMDGIESNQSSGVKKYAHTAQEGSEYFFSDRTAPDYGTASASLNVDPLWKDHRGTPLFGLKDISTELKGHRTPVPFGVIGELLEDLIDIVGTAVAKLGELISALGPDAEFDVLHYRNIRGYFTSEVEIPVRSLGQVLPRYDLNGEHSSSAKPLTFSAKAAVQSNNWNAGSRDHATRESKGLVVTSILSPISEPVNKVIKGFNSLVGKIPLIHVEVPGVPEFGYVEDDLIPYEHLEGNKKKLKSKSGLYSYE
ncbi:MAG: hypothetical protein ACQEQK_08725 [Thermodesulfobacteriota bacterium]